jgi:hypothetical protein
MTVRVLEHAPQVNLVERTILHAFQEMGAQLQFPRSPLWPLLRRQDSSDCVVPNLFQFCLTIANEPPTDVDNTALTSFGCSS